MSEAEERQSVITAASDWIGTPFHHGARVKRVGIDCANLVAAAFEDSGLERDIKIPRYSANWFLFQNEELLLGILRGYAVEIEAAEAKVADIVIYRFGRCYSHAGIICDWPNMVHAFYQAGKVTVDLADGGIFAARRRLFFRRKAWSL